METFLRKLQEALNISESDGLCEPENEVQKGDHIVGVLEDESMKRLYSLVRRWTNEGISTVILANSTTDEPTACKYQLHAMQLKTITEALMEIFWIDLRLYFLGQGISLYERPSIGVRKEWIVVWSEPKPEPKLASWDPSNVS